jgi:phthiocerol/phenolphthiocerol synthesis type-I polyketide synthase C
VGRHGIGCKPIKLGDGFKTNIGHLEPASGVAGLLKAMLALENGIVPPSLHGETPNPAIPFGALNLRLVRQADPIAAGKPYAGVNSFGFGGTNAHAILAAPPVRPPASAAEIRPPLVISARSGAALRALAQQWRDTLAAATVSRAPLMLRAAARRRDQHPHRLVALGDDPVTALDNFLAGTASRAVVQDTTLREGSVGFVYAGNGAQFSGMGQAAYRANAAFRGAIGEVDRAFAAVLDWSVEDRIAGGAATEELRRADVAQPILFAIEIAITSVLRGLGVTASGFAGHSVGEIAAAWAAGALPLDAAARLVAVRSRHQERTRGTGRMAVLALGEPEAGELLAEMASGLDIAAINSPRAVTVAGAAEAIAELGAEARRRGIGHWELDLDFAFHSAAMEPIRDGLLADLEGILSAAPAGELVSTVTGGPVAAGALDALHWWRNIREPVRFSAAIGALIGSGHRILVEIGPTPVLQPYLRDALHEAGVEGRVSPALDRRDGAVDPFPAIAARLHAAGHDLSGGAMFDGPSDPRGLPLYPWQRRRYWFSRTVEAAESVAPALDHPLLGFRTGGAGVGPAIAWRNHLDTAAFPLLAEHCIDGTPVLPAAAILDMALAAARTRHPSAEAIALDDVELLRPMVLAAGETREMAFALDTAGDWQLAGRRRLTDEPMTLHATGRVAAARPEHLLPIVTVGDGRTVPGAALYRQAARLGLDYGAAFRAVSSVIIGQDGSAAVALIERPAEAGYLIHPALLDAALHGLLALLFADGAPEQGFLPRRFGRVRAFSPYCRAPRRAVLRLTYRGSRSVAADIALYDAAGDLVAELADCWFSRVDLRRATPQPYLRVELLPAPLDPLPPPAVLDRLGEIVAGIVAAEEGGGAEQALLFDALVAAVVLEAVEELGDPNRIAPSYRGLLGLLQRFGAAIVEDGAWRLGAGHDLPEAGELWRSLLADTPQMVAELAMLAVLREELPAMLRTGARLDPALPPLAALRRASPPVAAGRAAIAAVVDAVVAGWPAGRPLRICETGATRLSDGVCRSDIDIIRVQSGQPCDLVVSAEIGDLPGSREGLVPGGAVLALAPAPNAFWDPLVEREADWRAELAATGFVDSGAAAVPAGPWRCAVVWARAPAGTAIAPARSLLLGVAVPNTGAEFAEALGAEGHRVVTAEAAAEAIVFAPDIGADPIAAASHLLPSLARTAMLAAERRLPLWLVTRGAQQPEGDPNLADAALWGLGRVLQNEVPGLSLRLLDLPVELSADDRARHLARELAAPGSETEIVWTRRGRYLPRLRSGLPQQRARPDEAVVATSHRPGLDHVTWATARAAPPGAGEIAVEVHAAGVNFRDAMWAAGVLPEEALTGGFAGAALGLECAGVVTEVGAGVEGIAVGDRVAGFAPAAMARRAVTRAEAVIAIPSELSFAAAATLPVAFVTAIYALRHQARLAPGEHVLIHAAAGGVGLAAIQIAKGCGAMVIATAGTAAKRAFLSLAGADYVCGSRELGFIADVREATGGTGVDVVLNSLHGEAMEASLGLLKPFGRFVELGKRDAHENRRLQVRLLRQNISYFAIDVDQLPARRPELAGAVLAEVAAALGAGEIRPLAHRAFTFGEIGDAFRLMQSAQHVGKLVLLPGDNAGIAILQPPNFALRSEGTYIVTGGFGGFGFAAARWLAERGAGRIALVGRRGAETPGAAERIAELEGLGATVEGFAADVADAATLGGVLDDLRARGRSIRGIVHAAAEIAGGMAADLDAACISRAFRAKLGGALALDRLTREDPLDFFWLFSSATTLIGAPGQGAYVASNSALEALARRRRGEGRPALAIAWGPIADSGTLAARPDEREALSRRLGARPVPAGTALAALPAMAASGLPVVALAEARWAEARHALPILAAPLFEDLRGAAPETARDADALELLGSLDPAGRRDLLEAILADEAGRILCLAVPIDPRRPLAELGMDSLMAIELRLAIEARLRVDLPLLSLAEGTSVAALAARLAERFGEAAKPAPLAELAARHEAPLDPFVFGGVDLAAEE